MPRKSYEKWKVYGNVFDQYTERLLFKLSSQGHFLKLASPVSIGKEANIFTAERVDGEVIIVKIYRLESCNFNKMYDYIKSDRRFENLKRQRRKVIFTWVMREYQNLLKARELGVNVPIPRAVMDHVLVLELIGDKTPAPQLKNVHIPDTKGFLEKVISEMKKLYKGGIVHGDLSEFNILVFNETPYLIDFSQGTTSKDPNYGEYWERDINNIARYFKKLGVKIAPEDIKKKLGFS